MHENTDYNERNRIRLLQSYSFSLSFFIGGMMAAKESKFQADLIKELRTLFPDAIIMKNDAGYTPGIPDWLILVGRTWAALEVKRSSKELPRPNQPYYVDKMNGMSFASFIFPENKDEVIRALQYALAARGETRFPKR